MGSADIYGYRVFWAWGIPQLPGQRCRASWIPSMGSLGAPRGPGRSQEATRMLRGTLDADQETPRDRPRGEMCGFDDLSGAQCLVPSVNEVPQGNPRCGNSVRTNCFLMIFKSTADSIMLLRRASGALGGGPWSLHGPRQRRQSIPRDPLRGPSPPPGLKLCVSRSASADSGQVFTTHSGSRLHCRNRCKTK